MPKLHFTYNYCRICGFSPSQSEEMNHDCIRFWSPDDGWKIGALCRPCHEEYGDVVPQPGDYAYRDCHEDICTGEPETDNDPTFAI